MKLYVITVCYYGKDLNEEGTFLGYAVAENNDGIFDYINKNFVDGEWLELVKMTREAIIKAKDDHDSEYGKYSDFWDKTLGWKCICDEVSDEDIATLERLGILKIPA